MFPIGPLTLVHVLISIIGIFAGCVVVGGMMAGNRMNGWTWTYLITTILTNVTGFFFPFVILMPSHIVGVISLIILPLAIAARYWKNLQGPWRSIYVISAVTALWFNVFVLMVQLFRKVPGLIVIAPTQQSPIFGVSQLLILAMFVLLGRSALKGFKNA